MTMFCQRLIQVPKVPIGRPISAVPLPLCVQTIAALSSPKTPIRLFTSTRPRRRDDPPPVSTHYATPEPPPEPDLTPKPKPRRRGLYYAMVFFCLGASLGGAFKLAIIPPEAPIPGSREDIWFVESIHKRAAQLPLVQRLSNDPAWTSWDAYENHGRGAPRLTSCPMEGARGFAYQKIFFNQETYEMVSVVHFGSSMSGWPGVVHGGALATILDESLCRPAIKRFPARTAVTARLELNYKAPAATNAFYVVRVEPVIGEDDAVGPDGTRRSDRKMWVRGQVENEQGKVCVEAKALFVVPKGIALMPLGDRF